MNCWWPNGLYSPQDDALVVAQRAKSYSGGDPNIGKGFQWWPKGLYIAEEEALLVAQRAIFITRGPWGSPFRGWGWPKGLHRQGVIGVAQRAVY